MNLDVEFPHGYSLAVYFKAETPARWLYVSNSATFIIVNVTDTILLYLNNKMRSMLRKRATFARRYYHTGVTCNTLRHLI